jgi:hypothetical protein
MLEKIARSNYCRPPPSPIAWWLAISHSCCVQFVGLLDASGTVLEIKKVAVGVILAEVEEVGHVASPSIPMTRSVLASRIGVHCRAWSKTRL